MILTERPYGAISSLLIQYRYEWKGKFYIVDEDLNVMEVIESEYNRCECPIKEPKKWR